jgi:CheY-like chemotaxis protein
MSRSLRIRLILADDHPVLREGLALILGTVSDMTVVAQASTGEEAFELFLRHEPDVLILDLQMPREGGLKTVKRLMKKRPGAKILILTTYDTDEEKDAAGKAVKRVYGVRGIANDIEVKLFWQRTDPEIARDAVRELESHVSIPVDKIRVTVKDGWVTLEGTVDWEYQKSLANWTALASSTPLISGIATSASTRLISGRFAIVRNASLALRRGRRET